MEFREVHCQMIESAVRRLSIQANTVLPADVYSGLKNSVTREQSPIGQATLQLIVDNADYARQATLALCQDSGVTIVFVELGQDVHIVGGSFEEAVNRGVSLGYRDAFLRGSILDRPFDGKNTGDNTPAVIHTRVVPGSRLRMRIMPKGGGADNGSRMAMLVPSDGLEGVHDFVMNTVRSAGPSSCPPFIVGVGIGGTFDSVGVLAKEALLRDVGTVHEDTEVRRWEQEWLEEINRMGIGPQGYGGRMTALAVHIETRPRHIASIPVAVNLQCHSARKAVIEL